MESCDFKNGIEDGLIIQYHPNGQIKWEGNYQNGKLNGTDRVFDENGQLIAQTTYVDNVLKGPMRLYYPNGKLRAEGIYTGEDDLVQNLIIYTENGDIVDKKDIASFKIRF